MSASLNEHSYLIVGGTTKAGTTSLFRYLADHPEICGAGLKETRFFLDTNYQLPSRYRYTDGLDKYDQFFPSCAGKKLRMEATPDYMYSAVTASRIRTSLANVKFVFCLRNPVDRLWSWYRYAIQIGKLSAASTFEDYLGLQKMPRETTEYIPHLHALEQGEYARYLSEYVEIFGRENVHIVWFDDLCANPKRVVEKICCFAGADPGYVANYTFDVHNKTHRMRNLALHKHYQTLIDTLRARVHRFPRLTRLLRGVRREIEPIYLRLNTLGADNELSGTHREMSGYLRGTLEIHYKSDTDRLGRIAGEPAPWVSEWKTQRITDIAEPCVTDMQGRYSL